LRLVLLNNYTLDIKLKLPFCQGIYNYENIETGQTKF